MRQPICVITGATGGVGSALAELAARRGYDLVLHGRSERELEILKDRLLRETSSLRVQLVVGDLGTAVGARGVAAEIAAASQEIDLLINNAGVLLDGVHMSPDGIEMHTQVNLIAPYILMQSLRTNVARVNGTIINVSSGSAFRAHDLSIEQLKRPERAEKLTGSYARSKLALSVVTQALGEQFSADEVTIASVDPGPNKTSMTTGDGMPAFLLLLRPLIYAPPEKGAQKVFDALEAAQRHLQPGAFFSGGKAKKLPVLAQSSKAEKALLDFCESYSGISEPTRK